MYTLKPWNKESEQILRRLAKYPVVEWNNCKIATTFGNKHRKLVTDGFIGISRNTKKHKSVFYRPEGVALMPVPKIPSIPSKFMKFKFYRIF